jgi:hypothetical protein
MGVKKRPAETQPKPLLYHHCAAKGLRISSVKTCLASICWAGAKSDNLHLCMADS